MSRKLMVFAKEPVVGKVKTRLGSDIGDRCATFVYEALVKAVGEHTCSYRAVDTVWWIEGDPDPISKILNSEASWREQPSGDLGERLKFAFSDHFTTSNGSAVVIGTDCPLLTYDRIDELYKKLESGEDCAVIPATDGGYVALGLGRYCPELFEDIEWSSERVLAQTVDKLDRLNLSYSLLDPLPDVDDLHGLRALASINAGDLTRGMATILAELGIRESTEPLNWVMDALGELIPVQPMPTRVLSLVPSTTECLFDLGVGELMVGRTNYCISPPANMGRLRSVGGPKSVDVDTVVGLKPDLVLANVEENDRDQVLALKEFGLRVHVTFPKQFLAVADWLRQLGALFNVKEKAGSYCRRLEISWADRPADPVDCVCLIWKNPYMTVSPDTLTHELLLAAGLRNLSPDTNDRYPQLSVNDLVELNPALVLLPSEPYEFNDADRQELQAVLPFARFVRLPGEWVTWYGLRVVESINSIKNLV